MGDDQVELDIAIQRVLLRAEDCLKAAHGRVSREGSTGISMMLAEARVSFGDAREILLEALDNVRGFIPKSVPFQVCQQVSFASWMSNIRQKKFEPPLVQGCEDMAAIKKMTENAVEMEQVAERLRLLVSQVSKGTAIDKAAHENKRNDIRLALVSLLRQKHEELSDRWLKTIVHRVCIDIFFNAGMFVERC